MNFKHLYEIMKENQHRLDKVKLDDDGNYSLNIYHSNCVGSKNVPTVNFECEYTAKFQIRFAKNKVEIFDTSEGFTPKEPCATATQEDNIRDIMEPLGKISPQFYEELASFSYPKA